jgi:hypothetical protein
MSTKKPDYGSSLARCLVKNYPEAWRGSDIRTFFGADVTGVDQQNNSVSGQGRFAFVNFTDDKAMKRAVARDGTEVGEGLHIAVEAKKKNVAPVHKTKSGRASGAVKPPPRPRRVEPSNEDGPVQEFGGRGGAQQFGRGFGGRGGQDFGGRGGHDIQGRDQEFGGRGFGGRGSDVGRGFGGRGSDGGRGFGDRGRGGGGRGLPSMPAMK